MNNFQKITKNIDSLIKFLIKNTDYDEKYWRDYLQQEVKHEDYN